MCQKFTPEQLKNMDMETKDGIIFQMQDRLDKLEHDYENLIEESRSVWQTSSVLDGIQKNWARLQDSSPFLMRRKRTVAKTRQNQQ